MKKTISKELEQLEWVGSISTKSIREDLDRLENLADGNEVTIDIEEAAGYGSTYIKITAYVHRLETDDEYNKRIKGNKETEDMIRERELETLRKLKLKYES